MLLPTYPFQRQRYWLEPAPLTAPTANPLLSGSAANLHPLVGAHFHSPLPPVQFQTQISPQQPAYLTHHRVFGQAILPAAAYLEIALAAAIKTADTSSSAQTLTNVAIKRGLILSDDQPTTVQTVLTPQADGTQQFQIFSLERTDGKEGASWLCHAEGTIEPVGSPPPSPVNLAECKASFLQQIPVAQYYEKLDERGLEYGFDFQAIQQLWAAPNQALGKITLPESVSRGADRYRLHPVLLDASFQILAAAIGETSAKETYLPASVEALQVYGSISDSLWAIGSIAPVDTSGKRARQLVGSVQLVSASGMVVAEVKGLALNRTNKDILMRYLQPEVPPALYELTWELAPLVPAPAPVFPTEHTWLILTSRLESGVAQQLIEQIEERGDRAIKVFLSDSDQPLRELQNNRVPTRPHPNPSPNTRRGAIESGVLSPFSQVWEKGLGDEGADELFTRSAKHYQINPASPKDFDQLIESLAEQSIEGVVYLCNSGETQSICCASVLHLVQALTKARTSTSLWLVTQDAQHLEVRSNSDEKSSGQSNELNLSQIYPAALWGLGRVVALEHPELTCRRIDLSSTSQAVASIHQLVQELYSPTLEDQIAYRQDNRYIARLAPYQSKTNLLPIPPGQSFQLKLTEYGLIDNLALLPIQRRSPAPNDVEIQVAAAGLNFRDVLNVLGLLKEYYAEYLGITQANQLTFGFECAGTVVAKGDQVSHLEVGDEVIATMLTDSVSRFVTTRSEFVIPKPTQISFAEAATLPLAFLTAYYGLESLAKLKVGDSHSYPCRSRGRRSGRCSNRSAGRS